MFYNPQNLPVRRYYSVTFKAGDLSFKFNVTMDYVPGNSSLRSDGLPTIRCKTTGNTPEEWMADFKREVMTAYTEDLNLAESDYDSAPEIIKDRYEKRVADDRRCLHILTSDDFVWEAEAYGN